MSDRAYKIAAYIFIIANIIVAISDISAGNIRSAILPLVLGLLLACQVRTVK